MQGFKKSDQDHILIRDAFEIAHLKNEAKKVQEDMQ